MKSLIVFAMILLGFYLVGCIRPHVIISIKKYMNIYVKVFFIKVRVSTSQKFDPPDEELDLPKKKKKPKKKKPKKPKKPKVKKDKKLPKKPKAVLVGIDILQMLRMLRDVLGSLFLKLWRYFRVRVKNFEIIVASEDAATTAMMYGAVCGYGDAILTILEKALDFRIEKGAKVGAYCDYLSDEMKMDVEVDISISIGGVFRYLFGIIGAALAGALKGLKIKLNREFFAQNKKYKQDLAVYNANKAAAEAKAKEKEEKNAAKEAAESPEEKGEDTEENKNEINNEDLKTETSERENTHVSEEE